MRTKGRHPPWQSSVEYTRCTGDVCRVGKGRGMVRSLLFLLVMVFSMSATIQGDVMRYAPGSDVELSWQQGTSSKTMEDDIQKLAK